MNAAPTDGHWGVQAVSADFLSQIWSEGVVESIKE
jgi:hypothetical protein